MLAAVMTTGRPLRCLPRSSATLAAAVVACGLLGACSEPAANTPVAEQAEDAAAPLSAETRAGPVVAVVSLAPPSPRLGDPLVLTLTVSAEPGVTVEMPAFGDALGRFAIVDYAPREETMEDGQARFSQRYTLQASASGRQRIPQLRVEFVDERDGSVDERGGIDDERGGQRAAKARELLTEELGFEVESVLPEGAVVDELRPARPMLAELQGPWWARHWPWFAVGVLVLAGTVGGLLVWLRRADQRARTTAFERAIERLERLQRRGLPGSADLDAWYVELSDIVRRYIEARFGLRAPELTTEEFLAEAGRSAELTPSHRSLLSAFLERCDRVKFARYSPGDTESHEALQLARQFLRETRDAASQQADASAPQPAPPAGATG